MHASTRERPGLSLVSRGVCIERRAWFECEAANAQKVTSEPVLASINCLSVAPSASSTSDPEYSDGVSLARIGLTVVFISSASNFCAAASQVSLAPAMMTALP